MPRLNDGIRVHIWMEREDKDWYMARFGSKLGFSRAIQTVLSAWRKQMEAKAQATGRSSPLDEINVEESL